MYSLLPEDLHSELILILYRKTIHELAVVSMEKCRRDFLWNKLLIGDLMDEEMKKKKKSDTEDSKDVR